MICYKMPFFYHSFYQIRAGFQKISHYKESSYCIVLFQSIQNSGGISILKSCIEGQIDYFFIGGITVCCMVSFQFFWTGVSRRLRSAFTKSQSPVSCLAFHWGRRRNCRTVFQTVQRGSEHKGGDENASNSGYFQMTFLNFHKAFP